MWKNEYLKSLGEWDRNLISGIKTCGISVGDVVFIQTDGHKNDWPLGRVLALNCGVDGIARSVELKTKSGVTSRPLIKLVSIEVLSVCESVPDINPHITETSPKRLAALSAKRLIFDVHVT